jgi:hypothetical protein
MHACSLRAHPPVKGTDDYTTCSLRAHPPFKGIVTTIYIYIYTMLFESASAL